MLQEDKMKATGKLTIEIKDKNGNLKDQRELTNLVVDDGLEFIASRMKDASSSVMSHMAIGTGSSAAAASDTTLGTEAGILNNSSGGSLLCRTVFSVINKGASDSMTITWTITIS